MSKEKETNMEWLLYINKETKVMAMREVYTKPTQSTDEIFMVITDKLTAMTICNRYNNEIAKEQFTESM